MLQMVVAAAAQIGPLENETQYLAKQIRELRNAALNHIISNLYSVRFRAR